MNLCRHWPAMFGLTGATVGRGNYVYVKGSFLHFCLLASEEIESFHQRQIKTLKRKRYFRLSKEGSRSLGIDQNQLKMIRRRRMEEKIPGCFLQTSCLLANRQQTKMADIWESTENFLNGRLNKKKTVSQEVLVQVRVSMEPQVRRCVLGHLSLNWILD